VRLSAYRRLGCREIFLQWVGLEGGRPDDWMASDAVLRMIFDEAEHQGLGVHVGLPYDQRWWDVLAKPDQAALIAYLDQTRARGVAYMQAASWPKRRAFRGWYVPYELEQYNCGYGAKRVVAFAIDPWVIDNTPEARALMQAWLAARV